MLENCVDDISILPCKPLHINHEKQKGQLRLIISETDLDIEGTNDANPMPKTNEVIEGTRPQRDRHVLIKFDQFEMFPDNVVTDDGDLIHFALLADIEPVDFKEAAKEQTWKQAMIE